MDKNVAMVGFLEKWINGGNTPQKIVFRCNIILRYLKRRHVQLVAQDLSCNWDTARKWIKRWESETPKILEAWSEEGFNPENAVYGIFQDAPRSGPKPKYTQEQVAGMVAIACQKPEDFGRPITNWTYRELAEELVKQGIVDSIPESTLRFFLKSGGFKTPQKPLLAQPKN